MRKDGGIGSARFPNLGTGAAADFTLHAVAPLSTTGVIVAATTANVTQPDPPSVVLAGLDSGGRTLWAKRYAFAGGQRALAFGSVRVTDDGGAFVTAIAAPDGGREGDLVAMKVHAKDGHLGEGTALTSQSVALGDYACTVKTRPFAPQIHDLAVSTHAATLQRR